ncbi:TlpA family protein disulfide reductase [Winogradskyella endarachnes]|uniref:Redoxin family protein n=1 Tax=Winogradskyella endarachnes TaxID=2681965 RepID=A0A6L6UC42_9FLAO|nr:TlpA disulfide reductase family protein [Winogradskyella endarachnes]MUU79915.1 redoxin family protein [Winogradskyella endarachnes]
MKRIFNLFICIIFSLNTFSQSRYIQKKEGVIVEEKTFYKEKNELVAKFKKKLPPEKYFDIIYEFEEPIKTNDSIIIKVSKVTFSSYPPKMNINNVFNEEAIKGKSLPATSFQTVNGEVITLDDLIGKPTIINFWHTACGPCIKEMPILNEIKKEYGDEVNFIAVTFETKEKVEKFLNKREFDFTHIINAADFMNSIQIKEFPKTFYLDKDGIVKKIEGAVSAEQKSDIVDYIEKLL